LYLSKDAFMFCFSEHSTRLRDIDFLRQLPFTVTRQTTKFWEKWIFVPYSLIVKMNFALIGSFLWLFTTPEKEEPEDVPRENLINGGVYVIQNEVDASVSSFIPFLSIINSQFELS